MHKEILNGKTKTCWLAVTAILCCPVLARTALSRGLSLPSHFASMKRRALFLTLTCLVAKWVLSKWKKSEQYAFAIDVVLFKKQACHENIFSCGIFLFFWQRQLYRKWLSSVIPFRMFVGPRLLYHCSKTTMNPLFQVQLTSRRALS